MWTVRGFIRRRQTVWNLHDDFSFEKRYNIAPSQEVWVIIRNEAKLMKYGLVPSTPNASVGDGLCYIPDGLSRTKRCT